MKEKKPNFDECCTGEELIQILNQKIEDKGKKTSKKIMNWKELKEKLYKVVDRESKRIDTKIKLMVLCHPEYWNNPRIKACAELVSVYED